ncbi:MAG: ABC transporter ATP-binding protein [Gammaproteobacteria bacterium]|nr:MAG: ABC transporter ATP-binding protein [Gammaproteobacteria bacterium]
MTPVLSVRSLSKAFLDGEVQRAVLEDLNLDLDSGEVLALMGPSGSGKSTLLNLLAGLLRADAGSIVLTLEDGPQILTELSDAELTRLRRRQIGYVFQFFNLVPTLTVRENVLLPLELNNLAHLATEALERLAALGLAERMDDFPGHLSGGERQRTAIARAMAHRPRLVLADEPTGNLDAQTAAQVAERLIGEVRTLGSGLVMATHSEQIAALADRVVRLDKLIA